MMATPGKLIASAAKLLFTADEQGETQAKKLMIGVAVGVSSFLVLIYIALQILMIPMNALTDFFLPDSIREVRETMGRELSRPIISTGQEGMLALPTTITTVSSLYGWRYLSIMGGRNFHEGIDFPVAFGSPVMAIAPGKVVDCGMSKDYGNFIMLEHKMTRWDKEGNMIGMETFYSFYAHLYKQYAFEGQHIMERQQIGVSGGDPAKHYAGNSTGAHLHLELRRTRAYASHFDPYGYVLDPEPFPDKENGGTAGVTFEAEGWRMGDAGH